MRVSSCLVTASGRHLIACVVFDEREQIEECASTCGGASGRLTVGIMLWMSRRGTDLLSPRKLVISIDGRFVISLVLLPAVESVLATVAILCLALAGIGAVRPQWFRVK